MKLDLRKLNCPEPVIRTKKELDKQEVKEVFSLVDNEVAKENLKKLGTSLGYEVEAKEIDGDFEVRIVKTEKTAENKEQEKATNSVILFKQDYFGENQELGKILIKSFIYTVKESGNYPTKLLFVNSGVKLVCQEGPILEDLKEMENKGVEVVSCGLCLDFFKLKESVKVGNITNMYDIYDSLRKAGHIIEI